MSLTQLRNLGIVANAGISTTKLGAGAVLQVVQASTTTQTTIASTSYTDTTLSCSITPSSTSSKILILVSQQNYVFRNTNARVVASFQLLRASTSICQFTSSSGIQSGTAANGYSEVFNQTPLIYLDSPSSTSSITYKTQANVESTSNGATVRCQSNEGLSENGKSIITLIEIAG